MLTWKTICVATDFSKPAHEALVLGAGLAKTFGATLSLVHVVELPIHVAGDTAMLPGAGQVRKLVQEGRDRLSEAKAEAEQRGAPRVTAEVRIAHQSTGDELLAFTGESHPDLLVLGTHGHTGLKHFLLGSVAEWIVRRAHLPVLTVRTPEKEKR